MDKFKSMYLAASLALFAPLANAGALADAVTAEVQTAELLLIGAVVLGVAGVIMFIRSGKRAAN